MLKNFLLTLLLLTSVFCYSQHQIEFPQAKFMGGDNKQWADPGYNDANWPTIKTNATWQSQGMDVKGFAWYRFTFTLPASLKEKGSLDSLYIYMAKIDDCDEIYLNGKMISKTGSFPNDPAGYVSKWNETREIHIAEKDPLLQWNKTNVLAVRVFDGDPPGGIHEGIPFVKMANVTDALNMSVYIKDGASHLRMYNHAAKTLDGTISYGFTNLDDNRKGPETKVLVHLEPYAEHDIEILPDISKRLRLSSVFTEKSSSKDVSFTYNLPYILTPAFSPKPRINGASVFGVRPNMPVLFKIPATGNKPLVYSVDGLPEGLSLDHQTGIVTGSLAEKGNYKMKFTVKNDLGTAVKDFTIKCGDIIALTPPMGWNSWNCWGLSVSDAKVRSSAQALIDKGLIDHGWTYINIDDGWEAPKRADNGEIVTNEKFPDMKSLGDWLHGNGLRFGIYSSPGPLTCGGYLGSYQHEKQDADIYNAWGIDYLKYDWCSYWDVHGREDTSLASYMKPYEVMQGALRSQPRDIVYSLCQYGMKDVWKWGAKVDGNCWRTTGDIVDTWQSLSTIGFNQDKMSPYAQPGRWNDPDMLIVGQVGWGENLHATRLTPDEQYTHISLWSLLSAPLLIGCDISKMDAFTLNLLTNDDVIAIDQDELGKQANCVIKNNDYQIWIKELYDDSKAIGIFNLSQTDKPIIVHWKDLGLLNKSYKVRDSWRQQNLGTLDYFHTVIPAHGVRLITVTD